MSGNDEAIWHLSIESQQMGPYPTDDIRRWLEEGRVTPETYCWREGMEEWRAIGAQPEFQPRRARAAKTEAPGAKIELSATQKRLMFRAGMAAVGAVAAVLVVFAVARSLHLGYPTPVRAALSQYNNGDYAGAYRTLDAYLTDAERLTTEMTASALQARKSDTEITERTRQLLHPEALFLTGCLVLLHGPDIVAAVSESEPPDGAGIIGNRADRDPVRLFEQAVKLDASYKERIVTALSKALTSKLSKGPDDLRDEVRRQCQMFLARREYSGAFTALQRVAARSSDVSGETTALIDVLARYDRECAEKFSAMSREYHATKLGEEIRRGIAEDLTREMLPALAQSLDSIPPEQVGTGDCTPGAAGAAAASFVRASMGGGERMESDAARVCAALLRLVKSCAAQGPECKDPLRTEERRICLQAAAQYPDIVLDPLLGAVGYPGDSNLAWDALTELTRPVLDRKSSFPATAKARVFESVAAAAVQVALAWSPDDINRGVSLREFSRYQWPAADIDRIFALLWQHAPDEFRSEEACFAAAKIREGCELSVGPTFEEYVEQFPTGQHARELDTIAAVEVEGKPAEQGAETRERMSDETEAQKIDDKTAKFIREIEGLCYYPDIEASNYELERMRRNCERAQKMLREASGINTDAGDDLDAYIKDVLAWIDLAETPERRFVFFGHMVSGEKVLLNIVDNLDGQSYYIKLGESIHGFAFTEIAPDNSSVTVTREGISYTILHK